jgi:outer membrane receptor protein involved in Fe transport
MSFNTSGTLLPGLGAGPLTGAFGLEVTQNRVNNAATSQSASIYERADLTSVWSDGFSGKTVTTEGFTELNLPVISGHDGLELFSLNIGGRYTSYYNKGGAGTTGQHATQNVFNWKFQTEFAPFDFVRFRMSRSLDQRAAGYRDLFIRSNGQPDQFAGSNPWREWNPYSNENRQERWAQIRTGNPDLKPEKSNTLTLGMVLSPGGWAQGMRMSVDYYDIRVKDGIATPFNASSTSVINSCWQNSGNQDGSLNDPDKVPVNGQIDYDFYDAALQRYPCREITFAQNADGTPNLQDVVAYNSARPINVLPYQRRGMDLSWNYNFPLTRAFEGVPGSMSLTMRATRALESSGTQLSSGGSLGGSTFTATTCATAGGSWDAPNSNCYIPLDLVGQIRSSQFVPGVAASPKWVGNISASYLYGDLTATLSARYIGGAKLDKTWCDNADCPNYKNSAGQFLAGSIDNNTVKAYANVSLNGSYNLHVSNLKQFQLFGSINNLFDKDPPFTGGGISGATSQYHDIMGRAYRMGVRMKF